MDELVALYAEGDLGGRVTGAAPRSLVRARNLPHAATAVLLRDGGGRVYVHRRTDTKDVYPGMHDVWAGGVVPAGEDPDAAARELTEELGVRGCEPRPCFRPAVFGGPVPPQSCPKPEGPASELCGTVENRCAADPAPTLGEAGCIFGAAQPTVT